MLGRIDAQGIKLCGCEDAAARQKPFLSTIIEREHAATTGHNIKDQLGVFPDFELGAADPDLCAVQLAQTDIALANLEVPNRVAHGR